MKRMRAVGAGVAAWLILCWGATAQEDEKAPSFLVRGIRPMSMGNAYEAVADDLDSLEYNPAGIAHVRRLTFDLLPGQIQMSKDLADQAEGFSDLMEDINDLVEEAKNDPNALFDSPVADSLVGRLRDIQREDHRLLLNVLNIRAAMPLPDMAGMRLTLGASFSNQVLMGFRMRRAGLRWGSELLDLLDDEINVQTSLDVFTWRMAVAGEKTLEMPYLNAVRGGLSYRIVSRRYKEDRFTFLDTLDGDQFQKEHIDTSVLKDGSIKSFGDLEDFLDANTTKETGFGVDLGVQLDHTDYLSSALVLRNFASSIGDGGFPATRTLGVAFRPMAFAGAENSLLDVIVSASLSNGSGDDYQKDFENDSFTDNLHLGAEATLFPNSPVRFTGSVGNNHGYPTAGVGMHLIFIDIRAAYYGDLETDWWVGAARFTF